MAAIVEAMANTVIYVVYSYIRLVSMTHFNSKATPTISIPTMAAIKTYRIRLNNYMGFILVIKCFSG